MVDISSYISRQASELCCKSIAIYFIFGFMFLVFEGPSQLTAKNRENPIAGQVQISVERVFLPFSLRLLKNLFLFSTSNDQK